MSGNTGTQSLAVMIRYLTTNQNQISGKQAKHHMLREIGTGLVEGFLISLFVFGIIVITGYIRKGSSMDSLTLVTGVVTAGSIMIALIVSTVLGALIPLVMNKINIDPAVASGPFITTISDIITLTLYYSISLAILLPFYL
jgi:magnesium transporter